MAISLAEYEMRTLVPCSCTITTMYTGDHEDLCDQEQAVRVMNKWLNDPDANYVPHLGKQPLGRNGKPLRFNEYGEPVQQ